MKMLLPAVAACALLHAAPARAQHVGHAGQMPRPKDHGAHDAPPEDHAAHIGHEDHDAMAMTGALGPYPMSREASGTAWQPDASRHGGIHVTAGDWMLMAHALLNGVYDRQQGPRGGERAFLSGMAMGMARRDLGGGTIQFRTMLSPDPLMGRRGYPLHLAAGESADGVTPLVDRQHPHDLFLELSASYSHSIGPEASLFLYAGLPGEPAFGPPAFMHRMSIMDSPEAPITHHWLDSTHISFGVMTAGLVLGDVKLEGSRFNGREPDQRRWNIETGPLDSSALRLSWNPTANLSLQASWAYLVSPEQLEPDENSTRFSASALYTRRFGREDWWSATLAWGNRDGAEALALEGAVGLGLWTLYGRGEFAQNDELTFAAGHHGPRYDVAKVSLGAIRDLRVGDHVRFGLGAQYALNFVPGPLEALYAGDPDGAMLFIRLKID